MSSFSAAAPLAVDRRPDVARGESRRFADARRGAAETRPRSRPAVPAEARLWGFVRNADENLERNPQITRRDTGLWVDRPRNRFLVVADGLVIDELTPLEFVQFVREMRNIASRILFKLETRPDGSVGRSYRVWR